jgi:hypothetical protein
MLRAPQIRIPASRAKRGAMVADGNSPEEEIYE